MTEVCPVCGEDPESCYRCQQCGKDLVGSQTEEKDDLVADGGFPEDHPLAPFADNLETHADHLDAYSQVLAEADPDDIHGVMLVMYSSDGVDTFPTVSEDVDARPASLWMLGAFIHHVASSAQRAGGSATMEEVAHDAIEYLRHHGFGHQNLRTDGGQLMATDQIVLEQVDALQDESEHGAPIGSVVNAVLEETDDTNVDFGNVFWTIEFLHNNGELYCPARGYLRRPSFTDNEDENGGDEA
ncbi:hypothetical protein [Natrinema halophilum]|uniref:hypothetical protein n=1 Tax=Natrinema halophilum TaxID=1699371 RepID=UPI001F3703C2|nr:hypothetical protein [Natrinema halophilum]UHQ96422.1 hypothetical protein HYG82_23565 [Natrinema halophilum]